MTHTEPNVSWRKRPKVGNVNDLLAMAHDRTKAGREYLVSAIGDLFDEASDVLSVRERAMMTDILGRLILDVEVSVRRKLAQRLADSDRAPHSLLVELANDEIAIAAPILNRSNVLQDLDLIEVIRHRTMEHQLAVAMRDTVAEPVSDALVQTGDPTVVEALLRNPGARFADDSLTEVVERSRENRNYREPLLQREELTPDLAKRMYWWVSAALRTAILERYALDPEDLDDEIEGAVHETLDESGIPAQHDQTASLAALLKLDEVAQDEMVKALRHGEINVFQTLFRKATGLGLPFIRVLMFEAGGERLAIACRAIEMAPKVFSAIYRLLRMTSVKDARMKRGELTRIASLYLDIKPVLARAVLRKWRRNPDYLAAIEKVTGKAPRL